MADDWHIKWLAEGVTKWNKRRKKVNFKPNLSGIRFFELLPWDFRDKPKASRYFEGIDLSDADLSDADLSDLNFAKAEFQNADLRNADLSLSNFSNADFSRARLTEANASRTILVNALFIGADLTGTNLEEANARGAVLVESHITEIQILTLADKRVQRFSTMDAYDQSITLRGPPAALKEAPKSEHPIPSDLPTPQAIDQPLRYRVAPRDVAQAVRRKKNSYDVFFGTNRTPIVERGAVIDFGEIPSHDLSFGVCEVIVPEGHRIGSIGSPLWKRILSRTDDRLRLDTLISLNDELFWEHLRQSTERMRVKERPTVFVHGYNTSFVDAALRAAQIGFDLGIGQGVGLFSWPSSGATRNYLADEAASEASKYHLANFIEGFVEQSEQKSINIIAHSMGCRCLLNAIEVLSNGRRSVLGRINQVILAAADVDSNLMPNLGKYAVSQCKRTTSYVCGDDVALRLSGWLHGYSRIGFRPPTFVLGGMDTVVVNDRDLGDFSHGYIGNSRVVLSDVFALLKNNTAPTERFSVEQVLEGTVSYWRLKD